MRGLTVCISIVLTGCLHVPPPVANIATEQTKQLVSLSPQVCKAVMAFDVPIEQSEQRGCTGYLKLLPKGQALYLLQDREVIESLEYVSAKHGKLELQRGTLTNLETFEPFSSIKIKELTVGYVISYTKEWNAAVVYIPLNGLNPVYDVLPASQSAKFVESAQAISDKLGAVYPVPMGTCLAAMMVDGKIGFVTIDLADVGQVVTLKDGHGHDEDAGLVLGVKDGSLMVFWYGDVFSECI